MDGGYPNGVAMEKSMNAATMNPKEDFAKNNIIKEVTVNDEVKRIDKAYPTQEAMEKEMEAGVKDLEEDIAKKANIKEVTVDNEEQVADNAMYVLFSLSQNENFKTRSKGQTKDKLKRCS
jgi:phage shock protein A